MKIMNNQLNEKLILAIRQQITKENNLATTLMDILSIGKEAVYRRLRGDVPFTFEEVAKVALRLGVSLDQIIGESKLFSEGKWAVTNVESLFSSLIYTQQYMERLKLLFKTFDEMQDYPQAVIRCATNHIPYRFTFLYEKLTIFRRYRWMYLSQGVNPDYRLSDVSEPPEIQEYQKQLVDCIQHVPEVLYILDRNIFYILIKDINYFVNRGLISKTELAQLKEELLDLLDSMKKITATGKPLDGKTKMDIYLSDITVDATYMHIEYGSVEHSFFWLYFIDYISFYNSKICQKQKSWIELLKRYSTHITQTGELQRFEFFKKQQELIEKSL